MMGETSRHFIVVNIETWCTYPKCPESSDYGLMEFSALSLTSQGFKPESFYHDYCKIDLKKIRTSCETCEFQVNPKIVSECPDDLLEGFNLWIEGLSHNYPSVLNNDWEQSCTPGINSVRGTKIPLTLFAPSSPLKKFLIITWGSTKYKKLVQEKLLQLPSFCRDWCDMKEMYNSHFKAALSHFDLQSIQKKLNLCLDTSKSGLGHCLNISKIAHALLKNGVIFEPSVFQENTVCAVHPQSSIVQNLTQPAADGAADTFKSPLMKIQESASTQVSKSGETKLVSASIGKIERPSSVHTGSDDSILYDIFSKAFPKENSFCSSKIKNEATACDNALDCEAHVGGDDDEKRQHEHLENLEIVASHENTCNTQERNCYPLNPSRMRAYDKKTLLQMIDEPMGHVVPENLSEDYICFISDQKKSKKKQKHSSSSKLKTVENAWSPLKAGSNFDELTSCKHTLMGLLNKISENNFDKFKDEFLQLIIMYNRFSHELSSLLLEKAVIDQQYSLNYAKLCKRLFDNITQDNDMTGEQEVLRNFKRILLCKCHIEFDKIFNLKSYLANKEASEKGIKQCKNDAARKELQERHDQNYIDDMFAVERAALKELMKDTTDEKHAEKIKKKLETLDESISERSTGLLKFMGDLYSENILTAKLMLGIINILGNAVPGSTATVPLCNLIRNVGTLLYNSSDDVGKNQIFEIVQKCRMQLKTDGIDGFAKFHLEDMVQLFDAKFVTNHFSCEKVVPSRSKRSSRRRRKKRVQDKAAKEDDVGKNQISEIVQKCRMQLKTDGIDAFAKFHLEDMVQLFDAKFVTNHFSCEKVVPSRSKRSSRRRRKKKVQDKVAKFESIMGLELAQETVWFDKWRYDDAEAKYYEQKYGFESIMGLELAQETVWFDKWRYDDAEAKYYEQKFG